MKVCKPNNLQIEPIQDNQSKTTVTTLSTYCTMNGACRDIETAPCQPHYPSWCFTHKCLGFDDPCCPEIWQKKALQHSKKDAE